MKINISTNLIRSFLTAIFFIAITLNKGFAQCGTEPITVSPWCENTFAEWTFTSPTANAQYNWYNYVTTPVYNTSGTLSKDGTTPIGIIDSTTTSSFYSPFRVTTAGIAPATSVNYTYQKKVSYTNINQYPATNPTFSTAAAGSTYTMSFTTALTNAQGLRFNSVTIPVVLNTVGKQYKIQVAFGTTAGPGSAVYTFSTLSAQSIGGNNYLVTIPINYTLTTSGAQTLVINTNPATGTGSPVDGLLYTSTQAAAFSAAGNPITIPAASAAAGPSGGFSQIYNWNYSILCNAQNAGASSKTTTGCCTVPASLGLLSLTTDKATLVNAGPVNATLTVGSGNAAHYFGWYLNGVLQGFSGVGVMSHVTNLIGNWEVKEVINQSDLSNPSCTSNASVTIQAKQIFLTNVTSPSHSPLCIGDQWTFTGSGASVLNWSSGKGVLTSSTGTSNTYTATSVGSDIVTLSGNVVTGNLVVNGDFSNSAGLAYPGAASPADPRNTDGSYGIASSSGFWGGQSDWNEAGMTPYVSGNPGNFMIVNGTAATSSNNLIWGQNITSVQPGQTYTFSFDMTSVTYVISDNTFTYGAVATAPYRDDVLAVYINGVQVGTASTNFAANGGNAAVGKWQTYTFSWTAGASVSSAALEIRTTTPVTGTGTPGRGFDYGLDNISFGGSVTQTDTYSLGPVTDCSTITAAASACLNDTSSVLTATLSAGLVFDHWEKTSNPGVSVGTTNPLTVTSLTSISYTAVATLAVGNLLDNGDFESGNIGFLSNSPYYTYVSSGSLGGGGNNQYTIASNTTSLNGAWSTLSPAPGSSGNQVFTSDAKGPVGHPIIGWTVNATAGQKYFFSGWVADPHVDFLPTSGASTATKTAESPSIGVYVNSTTVSASSYLTDASLTSLKLPNDQSWNNLKATWTAPSTGTFTIYLADMNGSSGGGNDFILDNFSLAPSTGIVKTATATTPLCNPCLTGIPTVNVHTFCGNTGTVSLTPAASDPATVQFNWYPTNTSTTVIGTSVGSASTTLDVSSIAVDGSGNKTVYYQKSAKGSGTVFKKAQSCGSFNGSDRTSSGDANFQTQFTASKPVVITQVGLTVFSQLYNNGDSQTGTVTFSIVGSKSGNGGLVADPTVVYGTVTATYKRTRTAAAPTQDVYADTIAYGNISVPAGVFFIYPTTVSNSGSGNFNLQRGSNCTQANTVDDLDGLTVSRTGLSQGSSNNQTGGNNTPGYVHDVKFNVPAYKCPRTAVTLTPSCPCTKPSVVTITTPATTPFGICQGTAQTLTGSATVTAASINGGFTYSWRKILPTPVTVPVAPTAVTIPANTATAMPSYTGITGAIADAGTYVLRVEDGNTGNSACYTEGTVVINVNPTPTITGTLTVCIGSTTTLTGSGTAATTSPWTSATTSVATVSNTGVVTGVSAGTSVITYKDNNGCTQTATVTVNALPTITGTLNVCAGLTTTLTGSATPATTGTWSSATTSVATVSGTNSTSGVVTGVAGGTSVITYTNSNGCKQTATVTVNPLPTVTGTLNVCIGSTTTLTGSATPATTNTWTSATTSVATVSGTNSTSGVVTGVSAGTSVITYTNSNGCVITATVTVNPTPTITGTLNVCIGSTTTLTGSGTAATTSPWTSATTSVATVSNTGVVTGVSGGTSVITYKDNNGCTQTATVTVNTTAAAGVTIATTPGATICTGTNVSFQATGSNGGTGATYAWTSSQTGATVISTADNYSSSGLVNGEVISVKMTSSLGCAVPNTATASVTMTVNPKVTPTISITSDKTTICPGQSVNFSIQSQTNQGTTPAPTYQWRKNGGNIAGATNVTYSPASISDQDVFDLVMTTGLTCVTSTTATATGITITVTPVPTISVTITADKTSICANNPVNYTATVTGSGATPAPTYEWFITSSGTAGSGTSQGAASTTATTFGTSALTATNNKVYVQVVSNAACAATTAVASNVVAVTVNAGITAGSIGSDQTICYNGTVAALTELTTSTAVTPGYVWEAGPATSGPWTAIPGATNANYTPPAVGVTTDVYIHRVVTDASAPSACASATSNIVHITVLPQLVAGTISANETTCSGAATTAMTSTAATGGTGSFTYQWQSNTSSATGTYTNIAGATNATYPAGSLTTTTYYQLVYTSGSCGSVTTTTPVTKTVTANTTPTVSINDPGQTCDGTGMTFTATTGTAGTTPTYQWYLGGNPVGTNSNTYAYTAAVGDNGKSVTVKVTSSDLCNTGPVTSAPVVLNIVGATTPTVAITTPTTAICVGMPVTFKATGTGTGGSPTYQWYESSAANPAGAPVGTNSPTYTSTTLTSSTDQVWVSMTSSLACIAVGASNPVLSNKVSITVKPIPTPAIVQATGEICSSEGGFTFTSSGTASGSNLQWQLNTKNISGATGSSYYASQAGDYTLVEDNGSCTVTSNPSTLYVVQSPVAYAGADLYVTEGTFVQLQAGGGTTGTTYSWTPTTGLSSSTVSNPSFKAENTTTYTVTLTNVGGATGTKVCTDQSSVTVVVVKPIVVPNVITVNGDGSNDTWKIQNIEGFPNATFEIFNRWGNLVWKSTGYPKQWDGTNFRNGEVLPDGTYFYIIDLHSPIFTDPYTGYIQIIK